jgi:hypothetical protein
MTSCAPGRAAARAPLRPDGVRAELPLATAGNFASESGTVRPGPPAAPGLERFGRPPRRRFLTVGAAASRKAVRRATEERPGRR